MSKVFWRASPALTGAAFMRHATRNTNHENKYRCLCGRGEYGAPCVRARRNAVLRKQFRESRPEQSAGRFPGVGRPVRGEGGRRQQVSRTARRTARHFRRAVRSHGDGRPCRFRASLRNGQRTPLSYLRGRIEWPGHVRLQIASVSRQKVRGAFQGRCSESQRAV